MFDMRNLGKSIALLAIAAMLLPTLAEAKISTNWKQRNGTFISGWYWLRDSGDAATWAITHDESSLPEDVKCEIWLSALVTHKASGGSGHDKRISLQLQSGTVKRNIVLTLDNRAPVTMDDSRGKGYEVKQQILSSSSSGFRDVCAEFKSTRRLRIQYNWKPTKEACCKRDGRYPHHVAVNRETMAFSFYQ